MNHSKKTPLLSVIIPCYNAGSFILEAIASVETYRDKTVYEIIIVDDGSTDVHTLQILDELKTGNYQIIHQPNQGPAAARNTGIRVAKGEYLLLLDSDNKIRPAYIEKGIAILSQNKEVGVVYGNPVFFGFMDGIKFYPKNFDLTTMLAGNYIDTCVVLRKEVWNEIKGFDETPVLRGHEDWEFWIRLGRTKWKFYYLNKEMFEYRLRENSMVSIARQNNRYEEMLKYITTKHADLYHHHYKKLALLYSFYLADQQRPFRSFIKYLKNYFTQVKDKPL